MNDLQDRFRSLETLPAPGLWGEIDRRAASMRSERGRVALALVAAAALLVVATVGGIGSIGSLGPGPSPTPVPTARPEPIPWTATGAWRTPLDGPAVRLLDGRVLVAGGYSATGVGLSSAALYDPATGTWAETGSLQGPRGGHTATLLPDGTVLVAGGGTMVGDTAASVELSSAELYDPRTGLWTATGVMHDARAGHTATLLPDGTVLVAGGLTSVDGNWLGMSSAELYDPRTRTWTATGAMDVARIGHTATLLPDGTVLVTGGSESRNRELSSAERYDPRTGSWTPSGTMAQAGSGRTATLLPDGRVLVVGAGGMIMYAVAELYDPITGGWTHTQPMVVARGYHTATLLLDGTVLIAGGADGTGDHHVTSAAELFDPRTGRWTAATSLLGVRKFHSATLLLDGRVLVTGGTDGLTTSGWNRLATAELYGPVPGS